MKKVLITGIDSFTGNHLSKYLEKYGYSVYGTSLFNSGEKKYVRYEEGAYLYSMGRKTFTDLAKEADAVRKIGGVCLVSIEKLNKYIEKELG